MEPVKARPVPLAEYAKDDQLDAMELGDGVHARGEVRVLIALAAAGAGLAAPRAHAARVATAPGDRGERLGLGLAQEGEGAGLGVGTTGYDLTARTGLFRVRFGVRAGVWARAGPGASGPATRTVHGDTAL